jgi:predicted acylesterase/phospholipase RssA
MTASSVNMNDGKYIVYDEKVDKSLMSRVILASAAIPFVFPNVQIDKKVLMDGGAVWNMNFINAVEKCKEVEGITDNS